MNAMAVDDNKLLTHLRHIPFFSGFSAVDVHVGGRISSTNEVMGFPQVRNTTVYYM